MLATMSLFTLTVAASGTSAAWPADVRAPIPSAMITTGLAPVRAGRIKSRQSFHVHNLSKSLSQRWLRFGTALGEPRYVRQMSAATMSSRRATFDEIFTLWNILDAMMWNATNLAADSAPPTMSGRGGSGGNSMPLGTPRVGRKHVWQTGYVRELQVRRMAQLARDASVSTYCEVGMNGGHSVGAMLLANPRLSAHVFDWMILKYSRPVANLLKARFGDRFHLVEGKLRRYYAPRAHAAHGTAH